MPFLLVRMTWQLVTALFLKIAFMFLVVILNKCPFFFLFIPRFIVVSNNF
ncbi:hypothetical protein Hanom_Chr08g00683401 [Helianthus anomalus]